MESLIAHCTLVLFVRGVGESMVLVVAFLMETFSAVFASERLVALVDSHVGVQGGGAIERLIANGAFVRFFASVYDLMSTQSTGLSETLSAEFTNERSGTRVNWKVAGEVIVGVKTFTAVGALEGATGTT